MILLNICYQATWLPISLDVFTSRQYFGKAIGEKKESVVSESIATLATTVKHSKTLMLYQFWWIVG